jgi:CRP-like cAMP-binding protein
MGVLPGPASTVGAVAIKDSVVLRVSQLNFRKLLRGDTALAPRLLMALLRQVGPRSEILSFSGLCSLTVRRMKTDLGNAPNNRQTAKRIHGAVPPCARRRAVRFDTRACSTVDAVVSAGGRVST